MAEETEITELFNQYCDPTIASPALFEMAINRLIEQAEQRGRRVGRYQAADKLYGIIPTLWLFKDNPDMTKMNLERTDELLKECEKLLNHNAKEYKNYIKALSNNLSKGDV